MLTVAVARSSSNDSGTRYVFLILWMTSYFHMMEPVGQNQGRLYVSSSSPGGDTRAKLLSTISDLFSFISSFSFMVLCAGQIFIIVSYRIMWLPLANASEKWWCEQASAIEISK